MDNFSSNRSLLSLGCWSYVGKQGGEQEVSIRSNGCDDKSTVVHELMHAIGYFHEQSRPDRDAHIKINYGNIYSGYASQFEKQQTDNQGTQYDYVSVMHYSAYAFSKNGQTTIERVGGGPNRYKFGNNEGLSEIEMLNL